MAEYGAGTYYGDSANSLAKTAEISSCQYTIFSILDLFNIGLKN